MDMTTLLFYLGMYIYGFSLSIWAVFFDKHPTKKSRNGGIFGLAALSLTVIYAIYVLLKDGIT